MADPDELLQDSLRQLAKWGGIILSRLMKRLLEKALSTD
jgi:hypothetical protein